VAVAVAVAQEQMEELEPLVELEATPQVALVLLGQKHLEALVGLAS
jgi:hypothetical protein